MKQFNLKEYLENPSRKVVTRDGKPARIICIDAKREYLGEGPHPVIALVEEKKNQETIYNYGEDGIFREGYKYGHDLFFAVSGLQAGDVKAHDGYRRSHCRTAYHSSSYAVCGIGHQAGVQGSGIFFTDPDRKERKAVPALEVPFYVYRCGGAEKGTGSTE